LKWKEQAMEDPRMLWLICGGIVLFLIVTNWLARRRNAYLRRMAIEMGFDFTEKSKLHEQLPFKFFHWGDDCQTAHVASGRVNGVDVQIADFCFTHRHVRGSSQKTVTSCVVAAPGMNLPAFRIRRSIAVFDELGKLFGRRSIRIPGDPEFSRAFVVQGEDESAICALFDDAVRDSFRRWATSEYNFEVAGSSLLAHHHQTLSSSHIRAMLGEAMPLLEAFRQHVAARTTAWIDRSPLNNRRPYAS
jgi:hypothetical protein